MLIVQTRADTRVRPYRYMRATLWPTRVSHRLTSARHLHATVSLPKSRLEGRRSESRRISRQPQPGKLPPSTRVEEVAIAASDVGLRGGTRTSAQDHLT